MFFGCSSQENHRKFRQNHKSPSHLPGSSERRHLLWVLWSHRQPRRPSACGADLVGSTPRTTWVGAALPSQGEWHMTGDTLKMCHQNVASLKSPINAGFGGKIIYKWLMFHCHAGLPEGFCGSVVNQLNRWLVVDSFFLFYLDMLRSIIVKKTTTRNPRNRKNLLLVEYHSPCKKICKRYRYFFLYPEPQMAEVDSAPICWTTVSMSYVPSGLGKTPMFLA